MNVIKFKYLMVPVEEDKEEAFITAFDKFLDEHSADKSKINYSWDAEDV